MSFRNIIKRKIIEHGLAATLHTRHTYTGEPSTLTSESGGTSITGGTYYYCFTATVGGVELWGGKTKSVLVTAGDQITAVGPAATGSTAYALYRSLSSVFKTPAKISGGTGVTYVDTLTTPSTGAPPASQSMPATFFVDSSIYARELGVVTGDMQLAVYGEAIQAENRLRVAYDVTVAIGDEITYNSVRYQIVYVEEKVVFGDTTQKLLYCKRRSQ